ncbi:MAG: hypothetical protein JNL62_03710 [Bryobacterales bacterium]|nr:hypothetical protein [Bryobacterales bacterium]
MDKNASNRLHAGIYKQQGEIGKLWERLQQQERIREEEECKRLLEAGIKRPKDRLDWIARHGKRPKHSGQTHLWTLRREGGLIWMEDLREK